MEKSKNLLPEDIQQTTENVVSQELLENIITVPTDEEIRISGRTHNLRDMPNRYRIEEGSGIHPNPRY